MNVPRRRFASSARSFDRKIEPNLRQAGDGETLKNASRDLTFQAALLLLRGQLHR